MSDLQKALSRIVSVDYMESEIPDEERGSIFLVFENEAEAEATGNHMRELDHESNVRISVQPIDDTKANIEIEGDVHEYLVTDTSIGDYLLSKLHALDGDVLLKVAYKDGEGFKEYSSETFEPLKAGVKVVK